MSLMIEDCAQAHSASIHGESVGSFGDVAAWSFCQDKTLSTAGEGGMVTTSRADLWDAMWAFKEHGRTQGAVFGREHPPGFRWLHERYRFAGLRLQLQLPPHRTPERHRPHPASTPARQVLCLRGARLRGLMAIHGSRLWQGEHLPVCSLP